VRRKTSTDGECEEGEGEMSFKGYWKVRVERAQIECGRR
jgi:hypothetical protein